MFSGRERVPVVRDDNIGSPNFLLVALCVTNGTSNVPLVVWGIPSVGSMFDVKGIFRLGVNYAELGQAYPNPNLAIVKVVPIKLAKNFHLLIHKPLQGNWYTRICKSYT